MVSHDKGCSWQSEMIEMLLRIARIPPYFTLKRNNFSRGKIFLFLFFTSAAVWQMAVQLQFKIWRGKNTNDPPELSSTHFNVNVTFKILFTFKNDLFSSNDTYEPYKLKFSIIKTTQMRAAAYTNMLQTTWSLVCCVGKSTFELRGFNLK